MTEACMILIVDDESRFRDSLAALLNANNCRTMTCGNGGEAVGLMAAHRFDIVLLDICMDGMDGFEVSERTAGLRDDTKFIMMTGYHSKELAVQAYKRGASFYLKKPFDPDEVLAIIQNLLSEKRKTDRLRLSQRQYSRLTENARDIIYRMTLPDGRYEYVNSACREIMGYSPEELYRNPLLIREIVHPDWLGYFERQWGDLLAGKLPDFYEYQIVHRRGDVRWLNQRSRLIFDEAGVPVAIEGIVSDITERKRYEKMLRESEVKFRGLYDLSPLPISVSDLATGKFIDVNGELCRFTKYAKEELIGRRSTDVGLFSAPDREKLIEALRSSGEVKGMEMTFRIKDGTPRSTLMFSKIIRGGEARYIISTFYDQTDRKNLEVKTQLLQRLETVATLSGGIAHQFNNALQNVVGSIELLGLEQPDNMSVQDFARRTQSSTRRMTHLVNQLLAYARGGKYNSETVDLNRFLEKALPSVVSDIRGDVRIETNLAEALSAVHADRSQLQMVLSAILINAVEAMEDGGRIVVRTANRNIDAAFAARYPGLQGGAYVCLRMEDNGKGMDEQVRNRIFEPFFTTKTEGRGLGMSAVYGIVKNHCGYVHVDSTPGEGTTVCVLLPSIKPEFS